MASVEDPIADLTFDSINDYRELFKRAKYAREHGGIWPPLPEGWKPAVVTPLFFGVLENELCNGGRNIVDARVFPIVAQPKSILLLKEDAKKEKKQKKQVVISFGIVGKKK